MRTLILCSLWLSACTKGGIEDPVDPGPTWCGDGIVQSDESCDDGNNLGGDGCTPACAAEEGTLEQEPNDSLEQAQTLSDGVLHGSLTEADIDCVAVEVPGCGAVSAQVVPADAHCPAGVVLELVDSEGNIVATGTAGADGCPVLDPAQQPGARDLPGGTVAVCARSILGEVVPVYGLTTSLVSDLAADEADIDGDGQANRCDPDRDGDGLDNEMDDCPEVPNGPAAEARTPNGNGFFGTWLALGPLTGRPSAGGCLPSAENILGPFDGDVEPSIGDAVGQRNWQAVLFGGDRFNLQMLGLPDPPREVYATTWVRVPSAQDVTLSFGFDDGARVWWNGVEVLTVNSCQGADRDEFSVEVAALGGTNHLMVKVHDQGGGWGMFARMLDAAGDPIGDVTLSVDPSGAAPGQSDLDGDGVGDLCDTTPAG